MIISYGVRRRAVDDDPIRDLGGILARTIRAARLRRNAHSTAEMTPEQRREYAEWLKWAPWRDRQEIAKRPRPRWEMAQWELGEHIERLRRQILN